MASVARDGQFVLSLAGAAAVKPSSFARAKSLSALPFSPCWR